MLGAIVGDIIGSVRENLRIKRKDFNLFTPLSFYTDDTVLTVAVADAILNTKDYGKTIKAYARRRPLRGYGPKFMLWMLSPLNKPYNSFGNGSAMRVSPVAHAFDDVKDVLWHAKESAECTHNHPEGIKGAQAVALSIFLARKGADKDVIKEEISARFGYDLSRSIEDIRPDYQIDITCQRSVPEAIIAFLDSTSFEDAIRNAVSLGGDADTQAAIAGAIAETFYNGIPSSILEKAWKKIPHSFQDIIIAFSERYGTPVLPGLAGHSRVELCMSGLRGIGYWVDYDVLIYNREAGRHDAPDLLLPDPKRLLEAHGSCQADQRVLNYLRSGKEYMALLGYSYCRFRCGIDDSEMGCRDLTDGTWVWPEGLVHYVEVHNLPLPEEFIATMEGNSWCVPDVKNPAVLVEKGFSLTAWKSWYEAMTAVPGSQEK